MAQRNDLPSATAPNFSARVRETLMTYLGRQGDPLDRGVTLRDLVGSGLAQITRNGSGSGSSGSGTGSLVLEPGPAFDDEPDLTPPPSPTGFRVTPSISHVFVEHDTPGYTQGHGHLRTHVYAAEVEAGQALPTFDAATPVGQFSGRFWALPVNPATTLRLWIKWESRDGVLSVSPAGGTNGLGTTTGQDVARLVAALTGPGNPFKVVTEQFTLPDGTVVPAGTYTADAFIHNGQIVNAMIANLAVDDAKIASLSASKIVAGSIEVGQFVESTGFVAGTSGWRINGDGTAEFSGVIVRGTIFATAGQIGGITIAQQALRAGQTAYNAGAGFWLGADGKFSIGNSAGSRVTWDGTTLTVRGELDAVTGTFGSITVASDGHVKGGKSSYSDTAAGFWLGLVGATPKFSVGDGSKFIRWTGTALQVGGDIILTDNLASSAVTVPTSGSVAAVDTGWQAYTVAAPHVFTRNLISVTTAAAGQGRVLLWLGGKQQAFSALADTTDVGAGTYTITLTTELIRTVGGVTTVVSSVTASGGEGNPPELEFTASVFFDTPGAGVTAQYALRFTAQTTVDNNGYPQSLFTMPESIVVAMEAKR